MACRIARTIAAAATAALILAPSASATSNTYVVNGIGDGHDALLEDQICATAGGVCTLRAAIEESNSAANFPALEGTETIQFAVPADSTIELVNGELLVETDLNLVGPGPDQLTVDAGSGSRVLSLTCCDLGTGTNVIEISGLTITGGDGVAAGAGILNAAESTTASDVVVTGNRTTFGLGIGDGGGGIVNGGSSVLELSASEVSDNRAVAFGADTARAGGILNLGTMELTDTEVTANAAVGASFARAGGIANLGNAVIDGVTVDGNRAVAESSPPGTTATAFGGGLEVAPLSASNATVVRRSSISDNSVSVPHPPGLGTFAAVGGGVAVLGPATIERTTIAANVASGDEVYGAGISLSSLGDLELSASTVAANSGTSESWYAGSGIGFTSNGGTLLASGSTIAGNLAGAGSPAEDRGVNVDAFTPGPTIELQNTVIADPVGGDSCRGTVTSLGHNAEDGAGCGLLSPTDVSGVDPALGPLTDNGGPTETMAPGPLSPLLDQGAAAGQSSDQRLFARPVDLPAVANAAGGDGSDIGAVELALPQPPAAPPGPPPAEPPDNSFELGKLKRDERHGTARLRVLVPGPGAIELAKTAKLKGAGEKADGPGQVTLSLLPRGKAKQAIADGDRVTVRAEVSFTPVGGAPSTRSRSLTLVRRR